MTEGTRKRPATRALLILGAGQPRGRRVRERLVAEAERRSMKVTVLIADDGREAIDRAIAECRPDAVAVCGDGWTQASVAALAAASDLPYSCVPSGAEDLLARDLGSPLDDPVAALGLPVGGIERTIDLGEVNGVAFVNYVAVGVEVPLCEGKRAVERRRSARGLRRPRLGRGETARRPVTREAERLPAMLVCNNRFRLLDEELGPREALDSGLLEVAMFRDTGREVDFDRRRRAGWYARSCRRFSLGSRAPVLADVDGEPRVLDPPLRFRSVAGALRVRVAEQSATEPVLAVRDARRGEPAASV
jgi:diacylglycerol kinase family enzyme